MAQLAGSPSSVVQDQTVRKVGFRLSNWQTFHGASAEATQNAIDTLQKMGCEVKQSNHGDHVDVVFRCVNWNSVDIESDAQAKQWNDWLVSQKFETMVLNPAADSQVPTVKIRLSNWKTIHASADQIASLKQTYEMIGCEVQVDSHGDHVDAQIRCNEWTTLGFPSSRAAHIWQDWLSKSGFETQHDHSFEAPFANQMNVNQGQQSQGNNHDHSHSGHDHEH